MGERIITIRSKNKIFKVGILNDKLYKKDLNVLFGEVIPILFHVDPTLPEFPIAAFPYDEFFIIDPAIDEWQTFQENSKDGKSVHEAAKQLVIYF